VYEDQEASVGLYGGPGASVGSGVAILLPVW